MAIRTLTASFPRAGSGAGGGEPVGGGSGGTVTGDGDATYTEAASITVQGITVNFTEPVQVAEYDNEYDNNIWVKPIAPATSVTVASYTPGFSTTALAGTSRGNGAMLNVRHMDGNTGAQGFQDNGGYTFSRLAYDDAERAAVPIAMSPDDCLVIANSPGSGAARTDRPNKFLYVHCVEHIPYADEFAPPSVWNPALGAKPRYRYSQVDEAGLPSVDTTGYTHTRPSAASVLPEGDGVPSLRLLDPVFNNARNNLRQLDGNSGLFTSNYGSEMLSALEPIMGVIVSDAPIADKRRCLKYVLQRSIDTYGMARDAVSQSRAPVNTDGGWHTGRVSLLPIGGHLLGDTDMRDYLSVTFENDIAQPYNFGDYHSRAYIDTAYATLSQNDWDGANWNIPYPDVAAQSPAMPEWVGRLRNGLVGDTAIQDDAKNTWSRTGSSYYRTTGQAEKQHAHAAALELMGLRAALGHPAFLHYQARHTAIEQLGDDPWRYVGGSRTPRYDLIHRAPNASDPENFQRELYVKAVLDAYAYPAGVTTPFIPRPNATYWILQNDGVTLVGRPTRPIASGSTANSDWTVTVDGVTRSLTGTPFLDASNSNRITLTLASAAAAGSEIRVSYDGTGTWADAQGQTMPAMTSIRAQNDSGQ